MLGATLIQLMSVSFSRHLGPYVCIHNISTGQSVMKDTDISGICDKALRCRLVQLFMADLPFLNSNT